MWLFNEFGDLVWVPVSHLTRAQRVMLRAKFKDGGEGGGGGGSGDGDNSNEPDLETLKRDAAEAKKLREENERYKQKHQEAEKHRKEQERLANENAQKAARAAGDIETLEKSWQEKLAGRETELSSEVKTYRGMVEELTAGSTASQICADLAIEVNGVSTAPALMPHVRARLKSEIVDGKAVTKILDANGNISAMTKEDLIKELKSTPYLAGLIVGSKANGGGPPGGPGGQNGKLKTKDQVAAMDPMGQAAYFKSVADSRVKYAD